MNDRPSLSGISRADGMLAVLAIDHRDSLRRYLSSAGTDPDALSSEAITDVRKHLNTNFGPDYVPEKPAFYASGKSAQQAHEAIRPTDVDLTPDGIRHSLTDEQFIGVVGRKISDGERKLIEYFGEDFPLDEYRERCLRGWRELVRTQGIPVKPGVEMLLDLLVVCLGWCGSLCPLGAFYSLVGRRSLVRMGFRADRCDRCGDCAIVCPEKHVIDYDGMAVAGFVDSGDCLNCARCLEVCPRDAYHFTLRFGEDAARKLTKGEHRATQCTA